MQTQEILRLIIAVLCAYLLGSISGGIIATFLFHKTDIREYGSGNAGMTNALRTFGVKTALLTTAIDISKSILALFIGQALLSGAGLIAASAALLIGHALPCYYGFRGGKCVICGAVIAGFFGFPILAAVLLAFGVMLLLTQRVAVGSICAAAMLPLATAIAHKESAYIIFACGAAFFVIALHRDNIKRLIAGTEPKMRKDKSDKR